jgi:hypothetical protein
LKNFERKARKNAKKNAIFLAFERIYSKIWLRRRPESIYKEISVDLMKK